MNVGDKIMCEGVVTADGEGFYRVQFPRVGAQAVAHVRVAKEKCQPVAQPKPVRRVAVAD